VYDEGLPDAVREKLVESIQNKAGLDDPMKKRQISFDEVLETKIKDIGTTHTLNFFKTLGIGTDFCEPAEMWSTNDSYKRGKEVVDGLKVVNDHAERAVKLIQDYNKIVRSEQHFPDLLLRVNDHRKSFPDCKKSTIVERYSV